MMGDQVLLRNVLRSPCAMAVSARFIKKLLINSMEVTTSPNIWLTSGAALSQQIESGDVKAAKYKRIGNQKQPETKTIGRQVPAYSLKDRVLVVLSGFPPLLQTIAVGAYNLD